MGTVHIQDGFDVLIEAAVGYFWGIFEQSSALKWVLTEMLVELLRPVKIK